MADKKSKYTSIGGQALIEGIMMRGPEKTSIAVRKPDGSIDISFLPQHDIKEKFKILKLPVIRGVVNFVQSMVQGYKALSLSSEKSEFVQEDVKKTDKTEKDKKYSKREFPGLKG